MTIELNGKITTIGELSGIIDDHDTTLGGGVAVGGTIITSGIAERGLKGERGDKGDKGAEGFSPRAYVTKAGSRATIKITDRSGTTTADVYDGSGGDMAVVHMHFDGDEYWTDESISYVLQSVAEGKDVILKYGNDIYHYIYASDTDLCWFGYVKAVDEDTIEASLLAFGGSVIAQQHFTYNIFSGDYEDLTNKPTIHDIPSGGYTGQVITKNSNTAYDVKWGYTKGRVWLGHSSTSSIESTKIVTTLDEDFLPNSGDLLVVFFNQKNTYVGNHINLQVDDAPAIMTLSGRPDRTFGYGEWGDGALVMFSYDNGYFYMVNSTPATLYNYGVTMLTNTISDNELYALTPKAVYDAGYLTSAHEVPSGGSAGQVLAKNTNTDYDLTWITPSGGGGGTSDYSDLFNKPSINSVTLSGNLSASDLSLASASHSHTKSDITDFPALATVATTGDYDDLTDKPLLVVNISQNGGTYSADVAYSVIYSAVQSGKVVIFKNGGAEYQFIGTPDTDTCFFGQTLIVDSNTIESALFTIYDDESVTFESHLYSIHNVPSGGTSGQVLSKDSNDDYDLAWTTPSPSGEIAYCTCTDSASTVAKTATVVTGSFTTLTTGAQVAVKFTYTNTATNPTLNVAGTGAKAIMRGGTAHVGTNTNESWGAGTVVYMLYDGSAWNIVGWLNTTYTGGTGAQIITGTEALNKVWSPQQIHDGIVGLADANVQSDWDQADNTADDYIKNKPTIPTVNNATLTIQKNGTDVNTFTANASSNVTANITVPTNTSDLNNDSGFITSYTETDPVFTASDAYGITSSDISNWNGKSDFSGSYNDLTDKPTIPTVNNATLTIQKNGTNVQTFTANASSNATADIVVHDVPSGGTNGQVLAKNSNTDYDLKWVTGGGGGGTLVQIVRWT